MKEVSNNEILEALHAFAGSVDNQFSHIHQRFEAIDQRFEAIDQRFDDVDDRLDKTVTKEELAFAIAGVRSDMVTKTYLDEKLRSLRVVLA